MNLLEDERVRFYFQNREMIEEWAGLRGEAAVAVDAWLASLAPDVEELARSIGAGVRVRACVGVEHAYPSFGLVPEAWRFGDATEPLACIALEWVRGRTTMLGDLTPCIGVKAMSIDAVGASLRASEAFRQTRIARNDDATARWAAVTYVRPPSGFPASANAYKEALVESLYSAWSAYAPHVAAAADVARND